LISTESAVPRLKEFIQRQFLTLNAPGFALGLTHRDHILYVGSCGLANQQIRKPVTPEPLFQISSTNKSFSTISLYQSQVQGLLDMVDSQSPEFIRFDVVSDAKAIQAILPGGAYSQTFTL
jgi:CubicO group peptidase (beta-lactamase class C family)